ncbi:hypothetical protein [Occallatibacter riparius]|uniref:Uncharacterized protein n=1 Tax=Occallatibacter riparius TaxID=1002689 RepID=A0A9J7BVX2_9BACT|nr:hypothetical protein [Occallatibacter riparius]UWZ85038.1 hypothetical protein MOP44_03620 [Occallatibacter riparius]
MSSLCRPQTTIEANINQARRKRQAMMGIFKQVRDWYANRSKELAKFSIHCDDAGIAQTVSREDGDEVIRLAWDQVARVFAYKRDLFSYDQICFVIECTDFGIEVREGDEGYESLIAQMQSNIPGFPAQGQWYEPVRLPPFAPSWAKIYCRDEAEV